MHQVLLFRQHHQPGAIPPPGLPGHLPGLPIQLFFFFLNKGKQTKKEVLFLLNPPPLNLLLLSISLPRRSISGSSEIRRTTTAITLSPSRSFCRSFSLCSCVMMPSLRKFSLCRSLKILPRLSDFPRVATAINYTSSRRGRRGHG